MNRLACLFLLLSSVCLVTGCTQGDKGPKMVEVKGTVTNTTDGKPLGGGQVRFTVDKQPTLSLDVKDGAFSGKVHTGKNKVEVVWNVEKPNPSMPDTKMEENTVAPNSVEIDVPESGKSDIQLKVASKHK